MGCECAREPRAIETVPNPADGIMIGDRQTIRLDPPTESQGKSGATNQPKLYIHRKTHGCSEGDEKRDSNENLRILVSSGTALVGFHAAK